MTDNERTKFGFEIVKVIMETYLQNKQCFIAYLKKCVADKEIPLEELIEFIKEIDHLAIKNIGSMYVSQEVPNQITVYFYIDDTSIILKREN